MGDNMKQLAMKAKLSTIPKREVILPSGYKFINFDGSEALKNAWKQIVMEPPVPPFSADEYWKLAIEDYLDIDLVPEKDIFFIENDKNQIVATITTITHANGTGYLHMVKMLMSERGKGLGQAMSDFSIEEFRKRGVEDVYLTTDDFRVPAVKTYLKSGYLPIIYTDPESDMTARWEALFEQIKYQKTQYVYEEFREYREIIDEKN